MPIISKICGLKTADAVMAAVDGGAAMVGFVFFAPSPRNLARAAAAPLLARVPGGVKKVALLVDPDNALLDAVCALPVDLLQLHGAETPARVAEVKARSGRPVIKALAIATADDVARAGAYAGMADYLLFDARPPAGATRPGGNAAPFDWTLLAGCAPGVPWLLAGGLTADNVALAVRQSGATGVDVSSGVEDAPGVKNIGKIRRFLEAVRAITAPTGG